MDEKIKTPQERWCEKNDMISKSYKLPKSLTISFAEACHSSGRSQASVLIEFMRRFAELYPPNDKGGS
ncbi:MAG: hypothetical protein E7300_01175 [Lachnospiraceae bacterium]|nr:hypothetical protein [Lachnospiraceae bacterium]